MLSYIVYEIAQTLRRQPWHDALEAFDTEPMFKWQSWSFQEIRDNTGILASLSVQVS